MEKYNEIASQVITKINELDAHIHFDNVADDELNATISALEKVLKELNGIKATKAKAKKEAE